MRLLHLRTILILNVLFFIAHLSFGQNPVTKHKGVSDPHIRIFNDTLYLYSGHDNSPKDKLWVMKDWRVFSSTNLLDWNLTTTISPKDNYMGENSIDCWASDAATRNGNYYFYFSDQKRGIGVMTSNSPTGPFKDPLEKPLVAPLHDPTIFIDDDVKNTPYIIYGDKSDSYYIAKLNDNMISTSETPKPIKIIGEGWKNAPKWMDKNYLFKDKDTYYLSWGNQYAISKNLYGPYKCVGAVGKGYNLNELAHSSFFWWKGQFYHIWCYYIKNGYKFRESIISYCHIDDNGKIVTDTNFLDLHFSNGVGQYNASWDKIEAEWYYEVSSNIIKEGTKKNGFVLTGITNNSWIKYANVNFETKKERFEALLQHVKGKGTIEIRINQPSGLLLGTADIDEKSTPSTINFSIKNVTGIKDVYLVFKGNKQFRAELDYIKFIDYF